jgi:hypothetical protein
LSRFNNALFIIPVIVYGFYIIFGKYVCIMGNTPSILERIITGLFFITIPILFFLRSFMTQ